MNFGIITEAPCENATPATDPRCSDPAFALANPEICPVQPKLIIKPGIALACQLGSVQFKAFIVENGKETDVTSTSTFTSADLSVAVVGVRSGNATGLTAGVVTITVGYQGQTAHAELNVLGCTGMCDSTVAMQLLIDNSRSMSQSFSNAYSTKLAFAKAAAADFAATINTQKDLIGARSFNAQSTSLIDAPTADAATVAADIAGILQTQQLTTFRAGIAAAVADLAAATSDLKVLIIVSDGEDTTSQYNDANNPLVAADAFKATGGVILCLGVRAHDKGFNLLEALATGGFFVNSYGATQDAAIDYLKGLRGYICAGNCTPAGDEIAHRGKSNYTGFINWDVLQGDVDILGNGYYDVLPGNGLYVDLRGSPVLNSDYAVPILRSKVKYSLKSGHVYRIALDMAGNQCFPRPEDTVQLTVFSNAVTLLSQQIGMADYAQGFGTYSFSFTAPSDMDVGIEISQTNDTGTDLSKTQSGVLLGRVKLDDTTDLHTLLDDDFDDENPTYIPPRCGLASIYYNGGYATGYNCYGDGCLDEPPPVQLSDPSPLPDIEQGYTPPTVYTSTKKACLSCGPDLINLSAVNLIPVMTGPTAPSGAASASAQNPNFKAYGAFDGIKPTTGTIANNTVWQLAAPTYPVWLRYDFDTAQTVRHYELCCSNTYSGLNHPPTSWTFQGSNDGSTWDDLDTVSGAAFYAGQTRRYLVDSPAAYLYYRLRITAGSAVDVIVFELAMFGAAPTPVCKTASATSLISQSDADSQAYAAAVVLAQAEMNCQPYFTSIQSYTAKCSHDVDIGSYGQDVTESAAAASLNSQDEADAEALAAAKAAAIADLDCTLSNNSQPITILDSTSPPTAADPYPSVKRVTGVVGVITKVTVKVNGITHFIPKDIVMVLRGPDGTTCLLMANEGNAAASNVSLTFDDAGATQPPTAGPLVNGTIYKPGFGGAYSQLAAPGPAQPHGTTLAGFNGKNPNGSWSLWVIDDTTGSAGSISSWDLTITAA